MFRLLRFLFYLAAILGFVWFGATVELGNRTLFGHIQNIWNTHESQELVDGAKGKVGSLVDRAADKVVKGVAKNGPVQGRAHGETSNEPAGGPPMEDLGDKDRNALRGIIGRGTGKP
jgi:hypothetical protein